MSVELLQECNKKLGYSMNKIEQILATFDS